MFHTNYKIEQKYIWKFKFLGHHLHFCNAIYGWEVIEKNLRKGILMTSLVKFFKLFNRVLTTNVLSDIFAPKNAGYFPYYANSIPTQLKCFRPTENLKRFPCPPLALNLLQVRQEVSNFFFFLIYKGQRVLVTLLKCFFFSFLSILFLLFIYFLINENMLL